MAAAGRDRVDDDDVDATGVAVVAAAAVAVATPSPPPSSTLGSTGTPPSLAHRLVSYLLRINDSTLWSGGACPARRCASQYRFTRLLPHFWIDAICSAVQMSKSMDLTLLMCVPIERWMPEQRMQRKQPLRGRGGERK